MRKETPISDTKAKVYPEEKRRAEGFQLMNFLLRPIAAPLVLLVHRLRVPADLLTLIGLACYVAGASWFVEGSAASIRIGLVIYLTGLLLELIDGGVARLAGPSVLGSFFSKLQADFYVAFLVPSLAIGAYRASGGEALWLLIVGHFGTLADLQFRAMIEYSRRDPEELARLADREISGLKRFMIAQILPFHPSLTRIHHVARIVRENLFFSSGIQVPFLIWAALTGNVPIFVAFFGLINIGAYCALAAAKAFMLFRGGGRLYTAGGGEGSAG